MTRYNEDRGDSTEALEEVSLWLVPGYFVGHFRILHCWGRLDQGRATMFSGFSVLCTVKGDLRTHSYLVDDSMTT